MKSNSLVLFIILIGNLLMAQWNNIPNLYSRDIYSIYFDNENIYAGGDSLFFISTDKGNSWDSVSIANKFISYNAIIKIDNVIYVGTYGEGVYRSTDNGYSWQPMNSGLGYYAKYINSFLYWNNQLYIATDGGGVYYTNLSSPITWQQFNEGLHSLYSYTINTLERLKDGFIAAAGASGFYYIRPDNSSAWIEKIIDSSSRPNVNAFVSFTDTIFAATAKGIFRSFNNGYDWDSVGIFPMPYPVTHLIKDNYSIYAGYVLNNDFYLWYSDDKGETWNFLDHQFAFLYKLYIYDNTIWAATNMGIWHYPLKPTTVYNYEIPAGFKLEQNYPNPFNPETTIKFTVPELTKVQLKVFNLLGQEIVSLVDEEKPAGEYNIKFDGSTIPSGIYFYSLITSGNYSETRKILLLK